MLKKFKLFENLVALQACFLVINLTIMQVLSFPLHFVDMAQAVL